MIVLLILKWIGIILLSILGLLLALLLIVLFLPFVYSISVDDKDIRFKIVYLFHFLNIYVDYVDKKLKYGVKIAHFNIFPKKEVEKDEKKEKPKQSKDTQQKTSEKIHLEQSQEDISGNEKRKSDDAGFKDAHTEDKESVLKGDGDNSREKSGERTANKTGKRENSKDEKNRGNGNRGHKISLKERVDKILFKVKQFFSDLTDKTVFLSQGYNNYTDAVAQKTYSKLFSQIGVLLKHMRPRFGKLKFKYGFEDPSTTGTVLALYSLAYNSLYKRIMLTPDFENACYEGKGKIKGILQVYVILIIFAKLYFDKNIKEFLKRR